MEKESKLAKAEQKTTISSLISDILLIVGDIEDRVDYPSVSKDGETTELALNNKITEKIQYLKVILERLEAINDKLGDL